MIDETTHVNDTRSSVLVPSSYYFSSFQLSVVASQNIPLYDLRAINVPLHI